MTNDGPLVVANRLTLHQTPRGVGGFFQGWFSRGARRHPGYHVSPYGARVDTLIGTPRRHSVRGRRVRHLSWWGVPLMGRYAGGDSVRPGGSITGVHPSRPQKLGACGTFLRLDGRDLPTSDTFTSAFRGWVSAVYIGCGIRGGRVNRSQRGRDDVCNRYFPVRLLFGQRGADLSSSSTRTMRRFQGVSWFIGNAVSAGNGSTG